MPVKGATDDNVVFEYWFFLLILYLADQVVHQSIVFCWVVHIRVWTSERHLKKKASKHPIFVFIKLACYRSMWTNITPTGIYICFIHVSRNGMVGCSMQNYLHPWSYKKYRVPGCWWRGYKFFFWVVRKLIPILHGYSMPCSKLTRRAWF